ncbi:MAG: class I SAM-dependent methyltransferase [Gaiella sp.]
MTDRRLDPPLSMPTYAVRAPLVRWLRDEAARAARDFGAYRVLDVGCGEKPYAPLFAPFCSSYVGVDPVANPHAEVQGFVEDLPLPDGSAEVVLCIQVLEHVDDPAAAIRELARVTAPGGRVLLSTHGVMAYHPSPADHWRWTHAGLERLFRETADWASVRVTPASGTTACLGMLTSLYLDLGLRRARIGGLARPLVAAINASAEMLDHRVARFTDPTQPGTLFANLHVVAERPT